MRVTNNLNVIKKNIQIMNKFSDNLVLYTSCFALIITMAFVAMLMVDLEDVWVKIMNYEERIQNLETLIMMHHNNMSKIGCSI
jgi:hypothetical protein